MSGSKSYVPVDCLQNAKSLTNFENFVAQGQGLVVQGQGLVN